MECNRHEPIQLQFYRLRQSISQNIGRKIRGVPLAVTVGRLHSRHHIQDTSTFVKSLVWYLTQLINRSKFLAKLLVVDCYTRLDTYGKFIVTIRVV
jgi:hypothetical protein